MGKVCFFENCFSIDIFCGNYYGILRRQSVYEWIIVQDFVLKRAKTQPIVSSKNSNLSPNAQEEGSDLLKLTIRVA